MYMLEDRTSGIKAVVDPSDAGPVLDAMGRKGWDGLDYILSTHHHDDHVGGNLELQERTGCVVVGAAADADRIPGIGVELHDGDTFRLTDQIAATVWDTSGHTVGHISFWFSTEQMLFVGDTLFPLGCGRLFEGTPDQMWGSLMKYSEVPDETLVFTGHDYTSANARFCLTVEPDNEALLARCDALQRGSFGDPGIAGATTMRAERATNCFLRAGTKEVATAVGLAGASPAEVFTEVRHRKDVF